MAEKTIEKRVVMARRVAGRWLRRVAHSEHRFKVLLGAKEIRNLPGLLRSFRDGKIAMVDVPKISDLGVKEGFDHISMWSRDRIGLIALKDWFEKRGFETTGIW